MNIFSPIYNIGNLIKKILRGGNDEDDDNNNNDDGNNAPIILDPDVRATSPGMLVYSSDMVPNAPPAPDAPPIPPTENSKPSGFLDAIKKG